MMNDTEFNDLLGGVDNDREDDKFHDPKVVPDGIIAFAMHGDENLAAEILGVSPDEEGVDLGHPSGGDIGIPGYTIGVNRPEAKPILTRLFKTSEIQYIIWHPKGGEYQDWFARNETGQWVHDQISKRIELLPW